MLAEMLAEMVAIIPLHPDEDLLYSVRTKFSKGCG